MKNKQSDKLSVLRQLLIQHYSESELRALCFDLGHDYELLPGREKAEKALELIAYCQRTNMFNDLLQACKKARPQVEWPHITDDALLFSPVQLTTQKRTFRLGLGLLIIVAAAFLIFITRSFWGPQDNQAESGEAASPSLSGNCFDAYFDDIQQDYRATVTVGESAHDFYFSDWGDRDNPSLLGLRLMQSGKPIAAVRYLFQPGSSRGETAFEVVGVIDGNCQEVGNFSTSPQLIENWEHLDLELPENAITISFNWQNDHVRLGVRQIGGP